MYRVMFTTPLPPTVKVAGAVSGFPFAMIGYPTRQKATTTGRQAPNTGLPTELLPTVRPARKVTRVKRPATSLLAAPFAYSPFSGYDIWSEPHA